MLMLFYFLYASCMSAHIDITKISQLNILDIVLTSVRSAIPTQSQCLSDFQSIYPINLQNPLTNAVLMYSSHFPNELGKYDACVNSSVAKYFLFKVSITPL